jgi:hypothetical protein
LSGLQEDTPCYYGTWKFISGKPDPSWASLIHSSHLHLRLPTKIVHALPKYVLNSSSSSLFLI